MKRRSFLSMAIAMMALMMLALTVSASAQLAVAAPPKQNPNCCTYTIEIKNTVPAACFPLNVDVEWGPGIVQPWAFAAPGIYVLNVPPPCPPAFPFNWVRILPAGPFVVLGATGTYLLPGCNYLATYTAQVDAAGCIYITIW